jgi:hypothetical protein
LDFIQTIDDKEKEKEKRFGRVRLNEIKDLKC